LVLKVFKATQVRLAPQALQVLQVFRALLDQQELRGLRVQLLAPLELLVSRDRLVLLVLLEFREAREQQGLKELLEQLVLLELLVLRLPSLVLQELLALLVLLVPLVLKEMLALQGHRVFREFKVSKETRA
jgi:hypothetical protein